MEDMAEFKCYIKDEKKKKVKKKDITINTKLSKSYYVIE